jgi:putative MATE family efflux protein
MNMNNLTDGPILKSIITLSIPIIIGNLLQTLYNLTDTFWVGRLGAEAVAAVSLSFPVIFFVTGLSGGIGMAGAVFVAQYKGSGNSGEVNHFTAQTFLMALLASIFFSVIGYVLTPFIVAVLGAEPAVIPAAVSYMRISFLGLLFIFGYMVFQSVIRGAGDAKTPMYIVLGTVLLNIILDPLFIFGFFVIPPMGVSGAAMATLATQGLALATGLILVFKGHSGIKLSLKCFSPNYAKMLKIIKLGIPTSLEQTSRSVGFIVMTAFAAAFGTVTLAAYGIGMRIISLVIIPALSLAITNSALVGQNMGAGKIDRAERITTTSSTFGFIFLTVIGILFFIFATPITAIFIPGDSNVIASGALFLKISALTFGLLGIQMALIGSLRGAGRTGQAMVIALSSMIVQIVAAFILAFYTPLLDLGIWLAFPISTVFALIVATVIYRSGKWRKSKLGISRAGG